MAEQPQHGEDLRRLQRLVDSQLVEIDELRGRVRELEARLRQVPVETLIESMVDAVEKASEAVEGRTIPSARMELRAALRLTRQGGGLVLAAPGIYPPEALSTVRFDVRRVPPASSEEARAAALAGLVDAALELQHALDEVPAEARAAGNQAQQRLSALVAAPVSAEELAPRLRDLAESVGELAGRVAAAAPAAEALSARASGLAARPDPGGIERITATLRDVAAALGRGTRQ